MFPTPYLYDAANPSAVFTLVQSFRFRKKSSFSVKEAISFLNKKGFEVTLSQKDTQKERKKSAEIIKFPSLA